MTTSIPGNRVEGHHPTKAKRYVALSGVSLTGIMEPPMIGVLEPV